MTTTETADIISHILIILFIWAVYLNVLDWQEAWKEWQWKQLGWEIRVPWGAGEPWKQDLLRHHRQKIKKKWYDLKKLDDLSAWVDRHRVICLCLFGVFTFLWWLVLPSMGIEGLFADQSTKDTVSKGTPKDLGEIVSTLKVAIYTLPVLFALWFFRDQNAVSTIENTRKDTNLKDFHQLSKWACGVDTGTDAQSSYQLKIAAVDQLRQFLNGDHGRSLQRPAFAVLKGAWLVFVEGTIKGSEKGKAAKKEPSAEKEFLQSALNQVITYEECKFWREFESDLTSAHFKGLSAKKSNLYFLNLKNIHWHLAELQEAKLQGANLSHAQLQGANLSDAQLQGANLSEANLQGAGLTRADLTGANLTEANLQGALDLDKVKDWTENQLMDRILQLWMANLTKANLTEADLAGANLTDANLTDANLQGALDLDKVNHWTGAQLMERLRQLMVQLQVANLTEANLTDANLQGANLQGALDLDKVNHWTGA
ncbi:MAG: pentapeptide repeat-containing protein, partial [Gammaproteobacteria bacterium]|nr:pentapeptide repeat-containing protein [Gammaproteobacteria bacterium]